MTYMQNWSAANKAMAAYRLANPLPRNERYACAVEKGMATLQLIIYQPDGSAAIECLSDPMPFAQFPDFIANR